MLPDITVNIYKYMYVFKFSLYIMIPLFSTDDIQDWMIWGYYASPMMYGLNAISINEFLDERWSNVSPTNYF